VGALRIFGNGVGNGLQPDFIPQIRRTPTDTFSDNYLVESPLSRWRKQAVCGDGPAGDRLPSPKGGENPPWHAHLFRWIAEDFRECPLYLRNLAGLGEQDAEKLLKNWPKHVT
jgi:hypothetical protein